jgi:hypothetical protein
VDRGNGTLRADMTGDGIADLQINLQSHGSLAGLSAWNILL